MKHVVRINQDHIEAALAGARRLLLADGVHDVALTPEGDGAFLITVDGLATRIFAAGTEELLFVQVDGEVFEVAVLDPLAVHAKRGTGAGGFETKAPMPGSVVAVQVAVGDAVQAGDTLVIIESMKLEVSLKAECAGVVAEVRCAAGGTFDKDAVLVILAEAGGAA